MAKKMAYSTPDGVRHEESYWRPVRVDVNDRDRVAMIMFQGFHTKEARQAGRSPIAEKIFTASDAKYDEFFAKDKLVEADIYTQAYRLADSFIETDSSLFFANAQDV